MKLLLVVCTGNICRSPMGEMILRRKVAELGKETEYTVESQGIFARDGERVSKNSVLAMKEIGIDISDFTANSIDKQSVARAEKIYVMSESHKHALESICKNTDLRIEVLNVNDPYGLDLDEYRRCRDAILEYFDKIQL